MNLSISTPQTSGLDGESDGDVDMTATPYTEYRYGTVSSGLKPVGLRYPGGKELSYTYDLAGRVIAISEGVGNADDGGSSGEEVVVNDTEVLVRYGWQGLGSAVKTEYVKPNLTLDYTVPEALDRFGRIADHAWKNADGIDVVRIQHGYDLVGNRLNRQDAVTPSWSETYDYDEMDQIAAMQRTGHSESWQYDPTGNWMSYNRNNAIEDRSHNAANEILNTVVHDANGNMARMPSPKDGMNLDCVYDAWNRLVAVGNNIRYEYDGRNHRIKKMVGNVVTKSFFNHEWQELESRTNDVATTYIWGLRYIDDLVLREKGNEKLYSVADPNWNVIATVDKDAVVQERFQYDAFGKVSGLTSDWDRTFTGQVLDNETELMCFRMRNYHTALGRFMKRDPLGLHPNSKNLYNFAINNPIIYVDKYGLNNNMPSATVEEVNKACKCAYEKNKNILQSATGSVICYLGKFYPCNFANFSPHYEQEFNKSNPIFLPHDLLQTLPPNIFQYVNACTIPHEEVHVEQYSKNKPPIPCSLFSKGELVLIPRTESNNIIMDRYECEAYKVDFECLFKQYEKCVKDTTSYLFCTHIKSVTVHVD